LISCSKESNKPQAYFIPVKVDSVSFLETIKTYFNGQLLDPNCHNGMDVYDNLVAQPKPIVVAGDTSSAFLLYIKQVYTKRMPQGAMTFSGLIYQANRQLELCRGALNN
jgi:hypothetical protein